MDYMGSILAMVICIAMSAYFSATETAFSSLNKTRLKVLADNGNRRAALTLKLAGNYDKLISTILIGNNIVNILVASIGTLLFVGLYGDMGATISTVVVTVVVLIFGEITPKSVAKDAPERFAMVSAPFIRLWIWVLTPVNFLFSQWKKFISRFFKTDENAKMSHEELLLFMEDVEQDGGIDENEGELLRNALEFRDLTAAEILTHRIELEAVEIQESHEQIAKAFTQSGFSRLLVYRDTIDQVVGILCQKDFYCNGKMTERPIAEIMTAPLFVYQHTKIRDILKTFQRQKAHIAVVIDDFGGTLGIVTMEDILEEIVGEIRDEYDSDEEQLIQKMQDRTYLVEGSMKLSDINDELGTDLQSEDYDSIGGLIIEHLDRVPEDGAQIVTDQGIRLQVQGVSQNRILKVIMELPEEKEPEDNPEKDSEKEK